MKPNIAKLRQTILQLAVEGSLTNEDTTKWDRGKLGEFIEFHYGKGLPSEDRDPSGLYPVYGANGELGRTNKVLVDEPAIIVGRKGSAGATNIVEPNFWASDVTYYVTANERFILKYIFILLRTLKLEEFAHGVKPGVSRKHVYDVEIKVPGVEAQKRIVAKVDELMVLCDEVEGKSDDFLETLTKLRQTILQLAIEGKLVPQDPSDEPASDLLKQIKAEKQRLVTEGKIRKSSSLPSVTDDEMPFEIPGSWQWGRFGDITLNRDGERIPLSKAQRANKHGQYDYYGASGVIDSVDNYLFDKKLLLIGEDGANLITRSKPIAFIAEGKYWVNNHAHVIDTVHSETLDFLHRYINAIDLKPFVTGVAQPKMNQAKMNMIVVGVPPIKEQTRIVAKVDELLTLCDALENKLKLAV